MRVCLAHLWSQFASENRARFPSIYVFLILWGYTYCFRTFLVRPSTETQQSHEKALKNVQMTFKDQSFVSKFKVWFVCLPEDVWPFKVWEMLKSASKVTLVPKKKYIYFPKNFELPAKFCGVNSKPGWRYVMCWDHKKGFFLYTMVKTCPERPQTPILKGSRHHLKLKTKENWHFTENSYNPRCS